MWDPDVLAGWELHNSSWGWISSRADQAFGMSIHHHVADYRYRFHRTVVEGCRGTYRAEKGFLLCYSFFDFQSLGQTYLEYLADLSVGIQLDPVYI